MANTTVNMEVPADMVEELQRFLENSRPKRKFSQLDHDAGGSGDKFSSSAPFNVGMRAVYVRTGELVEVINVHTDTVPLYYTVRLPCGKERQTEFDRLKLLDDRDEEEEAAAAEAEEVTVPVCTVRRVIAHRQDSRGAFEFKVQWASDNRTEWVRDEDCNTGPLISDYLHRHQIKTAYLFCRVSTKEQASSTSLSLQAQETALRGAVPAEFQRVRVFSISKSVYTRIPRALAEIGEAATGGDAIMVWRVDRLSRNIIQYLDWCEDLAERGVTIYSQQDNLSYNDDRLAFIQAIVEAQKEAMVLGERVKAAFREKRRRGDEHIGNLPYGKRYKRLMGSDGRTDRMVVISDAVETDIIKRIRTSHLETPALMAGLLNNAGIRKRGRKWTPEMVERLRK